MSDFTALGIHEEGDGSYRVNRFRIYFRPRPATLPTNLLTQEFITNFKSFFEPNMATVDQRTDHQFEGRPSLKFNADARAFFSALNIPDVHSDWVGIVWRDALRGFAAQTLRREFREMEDAAVAAGGGAAGAAVGAFTIAGPVLGGLAGAYAAAEINQYHFLAGRRSWVIATAPEFDGTSRDNTILALETAAIERFSLPIYQLLNVTGGALINDFDTDIVTIWTRLLVNYVTRKGFQMERISPPGWTSTALGASHISWEYPGRNECERAPEVRQLLEVHRHLLPTSTGS